MKGTENAKTLRRYRDRLSIGGRAIVGFGLWDIAKTFLTSMYGSSYEADGAEAAALVERLQAASSPILLIVMVLVLVSLTLSIFLRFYVGLSAYAEARGKRKGWGYVVLAVVATLSNAVVTVVGYGLLFSTGNMLLLVRSLITGIIEFTSLFTYVDLIRSAIIVKRLSSQMAQGR